MIARVVAVLLVLQLGAVALAAAPAQAPLKGKVVGFRMAGIEPDGDPIDQVVLKTRLGPLGNVPAINLVVDAYLENFQPDTTPILPDLLHPNQQARNLGGFLQGKAILADDAGDALYIGSFLAEAFLDNSNHAVMRLYGSDVARGSMLNLKGQFRLTRGGSLHGFLSGNPTMPPAAVQRVRQTSGVHMRPIKQILHLVTVHPAPMRGKSTKPSHGVPLHTGYGQKSAKGDAPSNTTSTSTRHLSPITIVAGIGAIAALLMAGVVFWWERRGSNSSANSLLLYPAAPTADRYHSVRSDRTGPFAGRWDGEDRAPR